MAGPIRLAARVTLWASVALICFLTFAWPFAVSRSPDQPMFKQLAVAVLLAFLLSILVLLCKARRT
jgi:membrane protease YdiL (CAAX protease family)